MLALDTSALLKRYVAEEGSEEVLEVMAADTDWCASSLCATEARVALCHLGLDTRSQNEAESALRVDWERFHIVPVDDLCLARATEIGCDLGLRTLDAVHLAAAERLPRPTTFVTFDARQGEAARSLGLTLAATR